MKKPAEARIVVVELDTGKVSQTKVEQFDRADRGTWEAAVDRMSTGPVLCEVDGTGRGLAQATVTICSPVLNRRETIRRTEGRETMAAMMRRVNEAMARVLGYRPEKVLISSPEEIDEAQARCEVEGCEEPAVAISVINGVPHPLVVLRCLPHFREDEGHAEFLQGRYLAVTLPAESDEPTFTLDDLRAYADNLAGGVEIRTFENKRPSPGGYTIELVTGEDEEEEHLGSGTGATATLALLDAFVDMARRYRVLKRRVLSLRETLPGEEAKADA